MNHPIPEAALDLHGAILGMTGSGKSNAAKGIAEDLMSRGERVCVIDPTGTWWGLRMSADGKSSSQFNPIIFGGNHADIPIEAGHGAAIAEAIGKSSDSAIIDTRQMSVASRTKFFADFAEGLLRFNAGTLYLMIDEAHLFAPQGRVADPQSGKMLHAANNLVSLGRGIGLRIILISQRPAKLHKDSLTQVRTLVAMQLMHNLDVGAVRAWIGECAEPEQGKAVIRDLPRMATGDAWVWSPQIELLERVKFPLVTTLDTGKPSKKTDIALKPLDVGGMINALKSIKQDVVDNDPKRLKQEIARLQQELKKSGGHPPRDLKLADLAGYERGLGDGEDKGFRSGYETAIWDGIRALEQIEPPAATPNVAPKKITRPRFTKPQPASAAPVSDEQSINGPQNQLLGALAWWAAMGTDTPTRAQVAAIAGWKVTSGHIKNVAGSLRAQGLIEYPEKGRFSLTPDGEAVAPEPDIDKSLPEAIRSVLTGPQTQIFDLLLVNPRLDRDDITEALGWSPGSGHIKNVLSSLRTLTLIDYPQSGTVELASWIQPNR